MTLEVDSVDTGFIVMLNNVYTMLNNVLSASEGSVCIPVKAAKVLNTIYSVLSFGEFSIK